MTNLSSFVPDGPIDTVTKPIYRFMRIESISAILLFLMTSVAIAISNSPLSNYFSALWNVVFSFRLHNFELTHSLREWINHGLMTIFFFTMSLELKREFVLGELKQTRVAIFALVAAIGGMVSPALIYWFLQSGLPGQSGWATVISTDTAFLVASVFLLGKSIPYSLRIFLLSLAIIDDMIAIIVVCLTELHSINWVPASLAVLIFLFVAIISFLGIRNLFVYFVFGLIAWVLVDVSMIHPTIVGVFLGFMAPTRKWVSQEVLGDAIRHLARNYSSIIPESVHKNRERFRVASLLMRESISPVEQLEYILHPWVGYIILPLFALANAGVTITSVDIYDPITISTIISYLFGKPLGILTFSFLAVKLGVAKLSDDITWSLLLGASFLTGIGFTMSIYIADLTFVGSQLNASKLGIILASIASMMTGFIVITFVRFCQNKNKV